MVVDKEKFNRTWNAEKVLSTYIILINNKGFEEDLAIRNKQFVSAITAYSYSAKVFDFDFADAVTDFAQGLYLDPVMTESQCVEFKRLMQQDIIEVSPYFQDKLKDLDKYLSSKSSRSNMFRILINYRCAVQKLLDHYSGVLECANEYALAVVKTEQLFEKPIKDANVVLDKLICLLMGKAYSTEISEYELIEKYEYPAYTENELLDLYYDNF